VRDLVNRSQADANTIGDSRGLGFGKGGGVIGRKAEIFQPFGGTAIMIEDIKYTRANSAINRLGRF
jgi:hypothetical protein